MATHWVYGCQLADGTFEFSDMESGCEGVTITGCLVESGEHEGKVAITHDYNEGCSVDEYACYDDATGKWRFEAEDECCLGPCPGNCSHCSESYTVTISGLAICSGLNGVYNYIRFGVPGNCFWILDPADTHFPFDDGLIGCALGPIVVFQYSSGFSNQHLQMFEPWSGCPPVTGTVVGSGGCASDSGTAVIA